MKVLHHATTIQEGYQGVLHIGGVRQTVQAVKVMRAPKPGKTENEEDCNHMKNGDSGIIRFKFKYGVELIEKNAKIMVREGNTKAFGYIKETFSMNAPPEDLVDNFIIEGSEIGIVAKGNSTVIGQK
jgi:GTPase